MPSPPVKMKVLSILAENSWKTEMKLSRSVLFHMETRVSLRYFVTYCMLAFFFRFIRTVFTFKRRLKDINYMNSSKILYSVKLVAYFSCTYEQLC